MTLGCLDWKNARVIQDKRCSYQIWDNRAITRQDAEERCAKNTACLGLHWYNNDGGDGRTATTGWYQGCGGKAPGYSNSDWDIIVKPTGSCTGEFTFY